jgi:glycosyltransferase involved in cell wall biosynthesis
MAAELDILIPTYRRPASLAITLTSLLSQTFRDFRVFISDQTEGSEIQNVGEVAAIVRILHAHGLPIELHHHIPRRGMAEQRQFLLDQATAPYSLFLDDDLVVEPDLICRLMQAIRDEGCGFVGSAPSA